MQLSIEKRKASYTILKVITQKYIVFSNRLHAFSFLMFLFGDYRKQEFH